MITSGSSKVNEIVECYIRAGVDVVNLQQPRALGIEELGKRYRGRIAFQRLCDIHHTLPTGDRQRVDADADALMMHWADREGGFICSDYGDGDLIGVKDPSIKMQKYRRLSGFDGAGEGCRGRKRRERDGHERK
jgi:hypothetical protein